MDDTGKDVAQLGVVGKSKRGFKRYETSMGPRSDNRGYG